MYFLPKKRLLRKRVPLNMLKKTDEKKKGGSEWDRYIDG